MTAVEEISVDCPYCGESFTALVDTSVDEQTYIEDCAVCCSPIVFDVWVDAETEKVQIYLRREND